MGPRMPSDRQIRVHRWTVCHGWSRMFRQIMNLGMAVVAGRDAVSRLGCQDLICFAFAVGAPFIRKTGLQEPAAAAAAEIVGFVGIHLDKIFFTHHGLDHIAQVFGHGVAESFSNQLAGVLNGKLDLTVLVPVGIDLEFAFPDPLGIILNDAFDFKIIVEFEFFQSGPDCEKFVPSLRIEPDLAPQVFHGFLFDLHDVFPVFVVGHEHAVVFRGPAFGAVGPVRTHQVQNLPQRHHFIRFGDRFPGVLVQEEFSPFC